MFRGQNKVFSSCCSHQCIAMPAEQVAAQHVKADPGTGLLPRTCHKHLPHLLAPTVTCTIRATVIGSQCTVSCHWQSVYCQCSVLTQDMLFSCNTQIDVTVMNSCCALCYGTGRRVWACMSPRYRISQGRTHNAIRYSLEHMWNVSKVYALYAICVDTTCLAV